MKFSLLIVVCLLGGSGMLAQPSLSNAYLDLSGFGFFFPIGDKIFVQTHQQIGVGYQLSQEHGIGIGAFRWINLDDYMGSRYAGVTAQYRYQRPRWIIKGEIGLTGRYHRYLNDYNYSRADLVRPFSAPIVRGQIGIRFWHIFVAGLALSAIPVARLGETWWIYDYDLLEHLPSYSEIRARRIGMQPFVGLSFPGRGPKRP